MLKYFMYFCNKYYDNNAKNKYTTMKKVLCLAMAMVVTTAWADVVTDVVTDADVIPSISEFGDEEIITTGILNELVSKAVSKQTDKGAAPKLGYKLTGFASTPKVGAYFVGSYKYSDKEGAENGPGFNARLVRAYVDGSILSDFKYRMQLELSGTPHIRDFYLDWAKYKEFSVRIGQFKRAFTFENPMNPIDVGTGDYSQVVKKLAGMGDRCGEVSMGGRDQGIQIQGDLFPVGKDKHRLLHYQLALYNGNGINKGDNNKRKDVIGTLQVQPIKNLFLGVFGWTGNWSNGSVTIDRKRYAVSGKYECNNWTVRSEYAHSHGYKASEVNADGTVKAGNFTGKADAFYAALGIPATDWLKIYLKYDQYRDQGTEDTKHTILSVAPNVILHKNLIFQLEYRYHKDNILAEGKQKYSEFWLETYVRF